MNASTVANGLLIGVAVVWILARQVQRARVKPPLLWLAPLILAYFGSAPCPPYGQGRGPSRTGRSSAPCW